MDMDDSESSGQFTVVAPGSADDPFTAGNGGSAAAPDSTPPVATAPASQPAVQPPVITLDSTIPETQRPTTPEGKAAATTTGLTQDDVNRIVEERLRNAQSGWDRANQGLKTTVETLTKALKDKEREVIEREREAKLTGLTASDQQRLKEQWNLDDERAKLEDQRGAVITYHQTVQAMGLFQQYHMFGVTEDELMEIKDIDKMESFCKDKKLAWFENGGTTPADDKAKASAKDEKPAPKGSTAPVDLGGNAPAPETGKLLTTVGVQSMGQNVKNMFA